MKKGREVTYIAINVFNEDIGGIRFRAETVISDVHPGISNCEAIDIV